MRKFQLLMCLGMVILLLSCNKQLETKPTSDVPSTPDDALVLTAEEIKRLPLFETTYTLTPEEILAHALRVVEDMPIEEAGTKSASVGRQAILSDSLTVGTCSETRAGGSSIEAKIYVVNFDGEAGYALIAGDKRIHSTILAYAGTGNLSLDTDNPGMQIYLENLKGYVADEISQVEALRGDSIYLSLQRRYGFGNAPLAAETSKNYNPGPDYDNRPGMPGTSPDNPWGTPAGSHWQVVYNGHEWYWAPVDQILSPNSFYEYGRLPITYPMLRSQWYQFWPYNSVVAQRNSSYVSGCIATAMAQIMYYHRKPATYLWSQFAFTTQSGMSHGNNSVNAPHIWENKSAAAINNIGKLMDDLGKAAKLTYQTNLTVGYSTNVPAAFRQFGYRSGELLDFNVATATNNLKQNLPIYVSGSNPAQAVGHAWVVDGLEQVASYNREYRDCYYRGEWVGYLLVMTPNYWVNETYYHVNWGWAGRDDGWYTAGSFRPFTMSVKMIANIQ